LVGNRIKGERKKESRPKALETEENGDRVSCYSCQDSKKADIQRSSTSREEPGELGKPTGTGNAKKIVQITKICGERWQKRREKLGFRRTHTGREV